MARFLFLLSTLLLSLACSRLRPSEKPLFTLLSPTESGVTFANTLHDTDDLNILNYIYFYNGGGVAAGDVNNDGLPDLYFTASQLPNKLYVNRSDPKSGTIKFEDVTVGSGVAGTPGWNTGVTMADVNADGWLDLYVCQVSLAGKPGVNQLFINNGKPGIPTFTERAAEYGLASRGYSTQAAFFDYDRDGDLDMYLLKHSLRAVGALGDTTLRTIRDPEAGDRLYRNDGPPTGKGGGFMDVSEQAGIRGSKLGYGLGIAVGDINSDGWPDLYVSNDFHENDYLYYNNQDGTFRDGITQSMGHTSNFSMGSDLADINNDAAPDLVTLDMQPDNEAFVKTSAGADSYDLVQLKSRSGFHYQYPRNALQLNQGTTAGTTRFSEIAQLSGVNATDWSWSALLTDLDNDGLKDLYITNGIARRPIDLDFFRYVSSPDVQANLRTDFSAQRTTLIEKMPVVAVSNFAFHNKGNLTFTNRATAWGLDQKGFSNGAAYADLDGDGDLDLVVNNINQPAFIYQNQANRQASPNHFVRVKLAGGGCNTAGIGAKVIIRVGGRTLYQELMPTRGFESSVEPVLTFGLGKAARIDSLTVIWPDAQEQVLTNVKPDQLLTLKQGDARTIHDYTTRTNNPTIFQDVSATLPIPYRHTENPYVDFYREPLSPHKLSTEGPAMAVGDVNGDGLDDVFLGGANGTQSGLFIQQKNGQFTASRSLVWQTPRPADDVDAAFFDADNDRDLDLYVVSGGNEPGDERALLDHLYLNDGRGNFSDATDHIPAISANGSCVRPADFDRDGDVDLFLGSRSVAGKYGLSPASTLLENTGKGVFRVVPFQKAFGVADAGMVTDAVWADINGDNRLDLVTVGEWTPVRVFQNTGTSFRETTAEAGLQNTEGWWNSVVVDDLDNDGDIDLIVGNLGLNTQLKASLKEPLLGYFGDFDRNGTLDEVLAYYRSGKLYSVLGKDELSAQMVGLKRKFVAYRDFANSDFTGILSESDQQQALKKRATLLTTSLLLNNGKGAFTVKPLPNEAQFAPVRAILTGDFDQDGRKDILLAGNFFGAAPIFGRYDAGAGLLLSGRGQDNFAAITPKQSGFIVTGEARAMRRLKTARGPVIIVAKNNQPVQLFR